MHVHISALSALLTLLEAMVGLGILRLWAMSHPDNRLAQGILTLY
jgi:hypothetical protein